ncbi:zinc-ribbon and DUF3426 domain-containing protein [Curvibacter sp. CHRR-16]|uniref:zinc-ribbon and DUF3426 domain-containing protein n=1 Tax=Curvibacter sp. CHRR-16 TaxID=2835872 RepID=UPI001BDB308F|nr:zinc-ribbon and DUF3426 domain-containing protein [Curvibacter sp. CHRR-16]MBT0569363.1 zinc-ribbon and DUF3426 domain-containing protein [Curvibacter sp. CHRR-16]
MSLITQCPACMTMFKVVPDQLRVSEGWVRCGQCDEVFDAQAHLIDPKSIHLDVSPQPEVRVQATGRETPSVPATPVDGARPSAVATPEQVTTSLMPDTEPLLVSEPWTEELEQLGTPAVHHEAEPSVPSFMQGTAPISVWKRRLTLAFAILLSTALVGQFVWRERDRMAAASPAVESLWQRVCASTGCALHPWRDVEALMLESSSFVKLRGKVYQIQAEIRNRSAMQLAAPALELTLTDTQEKPVVRKVLLPEQVWGAKKTLTAQELAATEFALEISLPDADKVVSGYRLIAFYP